MGRCGFDWFVLICICSRWCVVLLGLVVVKFLFLGVGVGVVMVGLCGVVVVVLFGIMFVRVCCGGVLRFWWFIIVLVNGFCCVSVGLLKRIIKISVVRR